MNKTTTRSPRRWLVGSLMVACVLTVSLATSGCMLSSRVPGGHGARLAALGSFPSTPVMPPPGWIFTAYRAPLDYDFTDEGKGTKVANLREGEAFTHYVYIPLFGPLSFAWNDVSIGSAAANGGITELTYADYETLSILGIYTQFRIRAYGN